jgi:hypothetical protein
MNRGTPARRQRIRRRSSNGRPKIGSSARDGRLTKAAWIKFFTNPAFLANPARATEPPLNEAEVRAVFWMAPNIATRIRYSTARD